jgi:hypothetical protein
VRYRRVDCVSPLGTQFSTDVCTSAKPAEIEPCNTEPCPDVYWRISGEFGPCSAACDAHGSASGVSVRPASVCYSGGVAVAASVCTSAGVLPPLDSRPCNRFPCPSDVRSWRVGEWSACVYANSTCRPGLRARTLTCVTSTGAATAASRCPTDAPATQETCQPTGTCSCTTDSECLQHGENTRCVAPGVCACAPGFLGADCGVPAIMSVLECTDGIVDVTGTCCLGRINRNGTCCAPGDTVDGAGACCTGSVDVCGVCNGTAVAVDVYGDCCAAPLTAAGICCDDGRAVDDCGVCSGTNECLLNIAVGAMVNASTALALSNTSSAQYEALRLQLATLVSQAMRVSLSAVAGLALSLADDSGRRLVRRSDASRVPCVLAWSHPFMRRRCICACACVQTGADNTSSTANVSALLTFSVQPVAAVSQVLALYNLESSETLLSGVMSTVRGRAAATRLPGVCGDGVVATLPALRDARPSPSVVACDA